MQINSQKILRTKLILPSKNSWVHFSAIGALYRAR